MRFIRRFVCFFFLLPLASLGQTLEQLPMPEQSTLVGWVEQSFPALSSSRHIPRNLFLGYVVNEQFQVLQYSAVLRPGLRPISQDIALMFPSVATVGSPMAGVAEVALSSGQRVGVIWVVMTSSNRS